MPEAVDQMVIDHSGRLHEGINDGRPDKFETATGQFLRHCFRDRCLGGDLPTPPVVIDLGLVSGKFP